ncbi:MAG: L-fuculokinase, partial [Bacteroidales bacterium]|nr:L-fuculokinase [Bacteroidales bacterium]
MEKNIIVLDCGATNVRAVAINEKGIIIAQKSFANQTQEDPFHQGGIIWDDKEIWQKLVKATKSVVSQINPNNIIGITVTTFGVDGAPYDKHGAQLYPVISWACQREHDILDDLYAEISLSKLYKTSGVNHFHFNTLYKLYWLQKNKPEIISKTDHWLFMPSIIAKNLSGTLYTDVSMLGTSMMGDIDTRDFSKETLDVLKMNKQQFPSVKRAGEQVGVLHEKASRELGIEIGIPVYAAGHDTQFAIFASGANENEVVLSSGTWEILMMRSSKVSLNDEALLKGVTIELDAQQPLLNPAVQWLGSGILEWIKQTLFVDVKDRTDIYDIMIAEARAAKGTAL